MRGPSYGVYSVYTDMLSRLFVFDHRFFGFLILDPVNSGALFLPSWCERDAGKVWSAKAVSGSVIWVHWAVVLAFLSLELDANAFQHLWRLCQIQDSVRLLMCF